MRPLRPFCGTVLKAQLLTLPATISTSANGVVTTQLSFLPPASSSATEVCGSSESRPATAQPPEPPPTTMKSYVSVTRIPPGILCSDKPSWPALGRKTPLLRRLWQGRFHAVILQGFWRHKNLKNGSFGPFQSRCTLIHSPRTRWLCPGCLLRKPPVGTIDAQSVGRFRFGSAFRKASQRFNAGWSSPVARQAHNLKVIGSNPIPATKLIKNPAISVIAGFVFWPSVQLQ